MRYQYAEAPRLTEIEARTLAAIMELAIPTDLKTQEAMLKLDEECFYDANLRQIFLIIQSQFRNQREFSYPTVIGMIHDDLFETALQLSSANYVSTNFLKGDIDQLLTTRTLRNQLKVLVDTLNAATSRSSYLEAVEGVKSDIQLLAHADISTNFSQFETYDEIAEEVLTEDDTNNTIKTDIPGLPAIPNQALIMIAGRSGHGKSFFALYMMDELIEKLPERQHLYFNLEMNKRQMLDRHIRMMGVKGETSKELIRNGLHKVNAKNVKLMSQPLITIDHLVNQSRISSLRQPIGVIVVDYLGLIRSKSKSERKDLEQSEIVERLAALAIELNCVVIGLIQVNRESCKRPIGDRCPLVNDSAESMGSVRSSTWWLGIDQPCKDDPADPNWRDLFQVRCRKNRLDSDMFRIDLDFRDCQFSERLRPFSASYTPPAKVYEY